MSFEVFHYLDQAIVKQESRNPRPSRVPAVWPSEASAERLEQQFHKIVGKCMRQSYLRMIGRPIANQIDAWGAWKWVIGRVVEDVVVDLARVPLSELVETKEDQGDDSQQATQEIYRAVYVANGVRHYCRDLYLPLELDLVVRDPETNRAWICECKTYDGYYAAKEIETLGQPKLENLLQVLLYLLEIPTGAKLKQVINDSRAERERLDKLGAKHRNRIEVNQDNLDLVDEGPMGAKLLYVSRGEVNRTEFTISIEEDFDGSHYPVVNGQMLKIFTIESVYARFKDLQEYWFAARREGVRRLAEKNIQPPASLKLVLASGDDQIREESAEYIRPTPEQKAEEDAYIAALEQEVIRLNPEFLPPAEYQWAYPAEQIELMYAAGQLTKKAYEGWKKKGDKVGDWQCKYCAHKAYCIPLENPQWAHDVYQADELVIKS